MVSADYLGLSRRAQLARLRPLAVEVLHRYDLVPARLTLLLHEFNTSFRVDTEDGRRFALRINVRGRRDPQHLDAEAAWLLALAGSPIPVPTPIVTTDGRCWSTVTSDLLGGVVPAVLMSWLPGRDLDGVLQADAPGAPSRASLEGVRSLGRTMAELHRHALEWDPPVGARFPTLGSVDRTRIDRLDRATSELLCSVADLVDAATDRVRRSDRIRALHADLHVGNVKWHRRRIAVFDFDDAALGVPAQDLAIAAYYLRDDSVLESALMEGYAEVGIRPPCSATDFEALVAGRNLQVLHDVLGGVGAADRDISAVYLHNTVVKLRAFLTEGRYRHDVPGLEALRL